MKKDWIRTLLVEPIALRQPVVLQRKKLDAVPLYCVPLAYSSALVLVALYTDFQLDGYQVVRLRDISGIQADARTHFHERILAAEQVQPLMVSPDLSIADFPSLLAELYARDIPVIVQSDSGGILLGPIAKAGKNKLRVRYIDAEGRADTEVTRIAYEDIASVCFGTRYLDMVTRYATFSDTEDPEDPDTPDETETPEDAREPENPHAMGPMDAAQEADAETADAGTPDGETTHRLAQEKLRVEAARLAALWKGRT